MRILVINYEFPPLGGGGGVICHQIARELARRHQVDVLTTGYRGLPRQEMVDGIWVTRVPVLGRDKLETATLLSMLSYLPSSLAAGVGLCRASGYDVINTHFAIPSGPTGVLLSRLFGVPNVLSLHGGDLQDPSKRLSPHRHWLLRAVVRWVLRHSDRLLAQSSDTAARARQHYGFEQEIEIIPWGLSPPPFEPASRAGLSLAEDDFVVVAIGRLIPRKALHHLIEALALLNDPQARLLLIGEGPERERLQALVAERGLEPQVRTLGAVSEEEKYRYLSVSDVFALPSLHEGFGLVFLEAMYCGLPVVTTHGGGQTDFLRDGETGFLVPVGDVAALAGRIGLLRDKALRERISAHNRRIVQRFTVANTAAVYERVFRELACKEEPCGG